VFELFVGYRLEQGAREESVVKFQTALNDYFESVPGGDGSRPLLQTKGPIRKIKKKYAMVQLARASDPSRTPIADPSRLFFFIAHVRTSVPVLYW
jgi:hypothetical protein